jgi:hypothetical protein
MYAVSAAGDARHYSYQPADVEVFPDLDCRRVRGAMLADIFALAFEVRKEGVWLTVIMSDQWMCMARGHEALPSCWLSMSRWLVAQEAKNGGAKEVAGGGA